MKCILFFCTDTTTEAKKGRGKTSGKWLRLFKKRYGNVKISVPLNQELNALSGNEAGKVARLLGMHIRQHCPVRNTPHWKNVSPVTQAVIIQAVLVLLMSHNFWYFNFFKYNWHWYF